MNCLQSQIALRQPDLTLIKFTFLSFIFLSNRGLQQKKEKNQTPLFWLAHRCLPRRGKDTTQAQPPSTVWLSNCTCYIQLHTFLAVSGRKTAQLFNPLQEAFSECF